MKAISLLLLAALGTVAPAETAKLTVSVSDPSGRLLVAHIVFEGDRALEFGPEISAAPLAIFDLSTPAWTDTGTGKRITLEQARQWAGNSKTSAEASMARLTDPDQKAFVQSLLTPSFSVDKSGNGIALKSRFLNYTVSLPLPLDKDIKRRILQFDELNAYRKAMLPRQPPPFTQLEVTRLLAEHDIYPGRLVMELTTPNGSVTVSTRYELVALSDAERSLLSQSLTQP